MAKRYIKKGRPRKFEMTQEEYVQLLSVSCPLRSEIEEYGPKRIRGRAIQFWKRLALKYGFRWDTAREGRMTPRNPKVFYAVAKKEE